MTDDILDDLFHGCAFAAFIEQASVECGPPDMEATRRRAYQIYEDALAERNRNKAAPVGANSESPITPPLPRQSND